MLVARIALRRAECELACAELVPRIAFVDRLWGQWKRLPTWAKAAVPMGVFAARKVASSAGGGKLGLILSVLPVAINAWKTMTAARSQNGPRTEVQEEPDA